MRNLTQLLVRGVCPSCTENYEVKASQLSHLGYSVTDPDESVKQVRGKGCKDCFNTGYRGQVGLFELLEIDTAIARMIANRASFNYIVEEAKSNGMYELRTDGLIKVLQGLTTPEEVERALPILR